MTSEAEDYLQRARRHLANARIILEAGIADQGARVAYQAGFNAAEALIVTRKGPAKTHRGLRAALAELARGEATIDPAFTTFLGRATASRSEPITASAMSRM